MMLIGSSDCEAGSRLHTLLPLYWIETLYASR